MPVLYNTGDWFTLGQGNIFRKFEIYNFMNWPQNVLENMLVSVAQFGGPIAITKDRNQLIKVSVTKKPSIKIFSSAGNFISSFEWKNGKLLSLGWSDTEDLLCIQDDGMVHIYDIFGNYQHAFSMGPEAKEFKILDAKIFPTNMGTGVAVMTSHFSVYLVNNIKEPKIRRAPQLSNPTSWLVITESRNTYGLASREKDIFKLLPGENMFIRLQITMKNDYKSIIKMAISYDQKHLAAYTNTGCIWLGSVDLTEKYYEFNTAIAEPPKDIAWIMDAEGNNNANAVIVTYRTIMLVIGINGEYNKYSCEPEIFIIQEMDGVRIFTNSGQELIQKIPTCVSNIFSINSQEPSSFLFEAHKKFVEKSHQSDEYLCLVKNNLELAVNECIESAGYEFDSETQKSLISAAYFGKAFISSHNPDAYIQKCRNLRVLNAIRHPNVGIPLTYKQFIHLTPKNILDRLVFRKHYGLAIQVAHHLNLQESRILEHWAFHKVTNDKNDNNVVKKISEKLKNQSVSGITFCNIAQMAEQKGRRELAIMLLELETKSSSQVPLLLKLGENKKALLAATQSGDTDLVYRVLLQLKETTPLADFMMIIRTFPMAQHLYKKYCHKYSISTLKDIYNQEDDFLSQGQLTLRESIQSSTLDSSLSVIGNYYKKSQKDTEFDLCEDYKKLTKQQVTLCDKYDTLFSGLSVNDTIKKLLSLGDFKTAEKFKSDFKISDRRYWWLRIQILSEKLQWEELEKLSSIKKNPLGFEPFVEVCLKQNNIREANKYIIKCKPDNKIKWFIRAGLPEEAATIYFNQRDIDGLWHIHEVASNIKNNDLVEKVQNYITLIEKKN